jgi:hypothetical protein
MSRMVSPEGLLKVYDELQSIKVDFDLSKADRAKLERAREVIYGLRHRPGCKARDPDEQYPLLGNGWDEDDRLNLVEAIKLLTAQMATWGVGYELQRLDQWADHGCIKGWRWLRATRVIQGPKFTDEQRRSFAFLAAVARNFREADRDRPLKQEQAEASAEDWQKLLAS